MKPKTETHAVDLVRHIRDEQAELLQGESVEEIIAFFRKAGEAAKSGCRRGEARASEQDAPPDGFATR